MVANLPYWRLSAFYFFFFAALGAFVPYWSLYLTELGLSPAQIGELIAIFTLMKIVSPNLWGWVADHSGHRIQLTRLLTLLATLAFCMLFLAGDYAWVALVMLLYGLFWHAITPQFEATTLNHLGPHLHRYSHIRLWGSIGFIVAVVALGPLLDRFGARWFLPAVVLLLGATTLCSFLVPADSGHREVSAEQGLLRVLRRPEVVGLLAAGFLMQMSHGPYYVFYSLYLQEVGYSRSVIGLLWGLGVLAEVVLFVYMHRIFARYTIRFLMLASLALTTVRWLLISHYADSGAIMFAAQWLHAASFGLFHAVAMQLVHHHFVGKQQVRGQSLYTSIAFGIGGGCGSYLSGNLWQRLGADWVFSLAAVATALAFVIAWYSVRYGRAFGAGG